MNVAPSYAKEMWEIATRLPGAWQKLFDQALLRTIIKLLPTK